MPVAAPTERKWCPAALALMVRSPWLAAVLRSSPAFLLAKGQIRFAEKCCQMFNGSFEADTATRMRYQSSAIVRVGFPAD